MGTVQKLSIALTPELAASVREAVDSGDYASASEIVREALRAWREARRERALIAEVRALVAEGDASGYVPYDGVENLIAGKRAQQAGR